MSAPRPLIEEGAADERALLRSAAGDGPGRRARAKTLMALGLAFPPPIPPAVAPTLGKMAAFKGLAASGALKAIVATGALVVASASTYAGLQVLDAPRPVAVHHVTAAQASAPAGLRSSAPTIAGTARPESSVAPPPALPLDPSVAPRPSVTVAPSEASPTSKLMAPAPIPSSKRPPMDLASEVDVINGARTALSSGDAAKTSAVLDRYQREYPHGQLGQEVMVLRVEALARSGNRVGAKALADRFVAENPKSVYVARVRSLAGDPP